MKNPGGAPKIPHVNVKSRKNWGKFYYIYILN
ncbi:hypothetical protein cd3_084 [Carnobacterium phage cd3]|uniref:Uncharacterized protein n=2 Tax=Carnodivirus TaxID=3044682 RepID=A0AAE7SWB8_9CAUD|nr:hypothetical protein PQD68_gp084 [Carnobacterium phage cd2]YP_010676548.1 hypothetical protein PQD69_gp082 [Carnobacterium phage cd4]QXP45210.1 hypothetical protein cd2_084 [Carnobacterium phage cd2]QXP45235.1 hypothetical protein cd3_084 [Carnobacterium phage cd3]QXP45428.1 hypothetical protein cd4_082 [Carnobacterium phage cd4]